MPGSESAATSRRFAKKRCGFAAKCWPLFNDSTLDVFISKLSEYGVSKGTIRFQPEIPRPARFIS